MIKKEKIYEAPEATILNLTSESIVCASVITVDNDPFVEDDDDNYGLWR